MLVILWAQGAWSGEILEAFPEQIDPDGSYVFYSHGLIVEGSDTRPVHPRWGVYQFPEIRLALARGSEFTLIADHRRADTLVSAYVVQFEEWVRRLLDQGVAPQHITLVGFSRGGEITARTASRLKPLPINTVLLATCWERGVQDDPEITFVGRFLSIYESSDVALTCEKIAQRSEGLGEFEELEISTGAEHGAFFRPRDAWVVPLLDWIQAANE